MGLSFSMAVLTLMDSKNHHKSCGLLDSSYENSLLNEKDRKKLKKLNIYMIINKNGP